MSKPPPWMDLFMFQLNHRAIRLVWTGKHTRCLRLDGTTAPSGVAVIYGAIDEGWDNWRDKLKPPLDQTKEELCTASVSG